MTDQSPRTAAVPLRVKLLSAIKEARYLPRTLRLVWTAAGRCTIAWAALLVFQGLLPIAVVYLVRAVVNALVAASAAGGDWPHFRGVLFIAAPLGAIMLLAMVLDSLMAWIRTVQANLVSCHIADLIHQKCGEVDMAFYETPAFFDKLHPAFDSFSQQIPRIDETIKVPLRCDEEPVERPLEREHRSFKLRPQRRTRSPYLHTGIDDVDLAALNVGPHQGHVRGADVLRG